MTASRIIDSARTSFALEFQTSSRMSPLQPLFSWLPAVAALHAIVRRFFDPGGWLGRIRITDTVCCPALSIWIMWIHCRFWNPITTPTSSGAAVHRLSVLRCSPLNFRLSVKRLVTSGGRGIFENPGTKALLSQFPNRDLRHPVNSSIMMLGSKSQLSQVFGRL